MSVTATDYNLDASTADSGGASQGDHIGDNRQEPESSPLAPVLAAAPGIYADASSTAPQNASGRSWAHPASSADAEGDPGPVGHIYRELDRIWGEATPRVRLIMDKVIARDKPESPRSLVPQTGVSVESIRRSRRNTQRTVEQTTGGALGEIADWMRHVMGPVTPADAFGEWVDVIFDDSGYGEEVTDLARRLLVKELGYTVLGGFACDRDAVQVVETLKNAAPRVVDDVGLVDEEALQGHLPDNRWMEHYRTLLGCCGFYDVNGRLSLLDSRPAVVKAALLNIGRPATIEEIRVEAGMVSYPIKAAAAACSAASSIHKVDRTRWAVTDWGHDVYTGITDEIIKRIKENGGSASVARILEELPRKFDVKEASVLSFMSSRQFDWADGMISIADVASIRYEDFDSVIDGRRTADGYPYWPFQVKEVYLAGYSCSSLPPAIAVALGCGPDGKAKVRVAYPEGVKPVSVIWRLRTVQRGAEMGHIAAPLRKLGVVAGDYVRFVIKDDQTIEFRRGKPRGG